MRQVDDRGRQVERALGLYGDLVLRVACARLGNRADAEDVAQTVFLRLLESDLALADDERVKAWLLRATANAAVDVRRSPWSRRRVDVPVEAQPGSPDPAEAADDGHDELRQALAQLSPEQRTAIHLHYYEGLSTDEAARVMGMRPSTVRSHLRRGRAKLETLLGGAR